MTRCLLVVDLEATCWPKRARMQEERETIEIGAVLLDPEGGVLGEHQSLVRPVRHPELSDFCRQLTGIRQAEVGEAPTFEMALASFLAWIGEPWSVRFASWGKHDPRQLRRDCLRHGLAYPFVEDELDLKAEVGRLIGCGPTGLRRALAVAGLAVDALPHRALADARLTAHLWRHARERASGAESAARRGTARLPAAFPTSVRAPRKG